MNTLNRFYTTSILTVLSMLLLSACGGGGGGGGTTPTTRSWGVAELIEFDDAGGVSAPEVAFDSDGNAIAVWVQDNGSGEFHLMANRYDKGNGWGVAQPLEIVTGSATDPQVAFDVDGNALVVWAHRDAGLWSIYSIRYVAGSGWSGADLDKIEFVDDGDAHDPQIAMDASGNGLAVWEQSDGTQFDIWANRYVVNVGWDNAGIIDNNAGDARSPQIAIGAQGVALAVWSQSDGTRNNIWTNRFDGGWTLPEKIEVDDIDDAFDPKIAMDASGNGFAVWEQNDTFRANLMANRYVAGSGWDDTAAELIETDNSGSALNPEIAIDGNGNVLVVWDQFDGMRSNVWANRYINGTGWQIAERIETDDIDDAKKPQIAMDADGNALAVWHQSDGMHNNIWANYYINGTGWGTAELIETDDTDNAERPAIAMDSDGNGIAVWRQFITGFDIWANRFE